MTLSTTSPKYSDWVLLARRGLGMSFCSVALLHGGGASAQQASPRDMQGWRIEAPLDQEDSERDRLQLTNNASQPFEQGGRRIFASLTAKCVYVVETRKLMRTLSISFSETVSVSREIIRVRIDNGPITEISGLFPMDGRRVPLPPIVGMKAGKTMNVGIALPWAGSVSLDFAIDGTDAAFSKLRCSDPKKI